MAETETPKIIPRNETRQDRPQETQADSQNDRRNGRPSNPQLPTGSVGMQDVLPRITQAANALTKIAASYGGTGRFFASDGATATPSYTFTNDTSAGIFLSANGPTIVFGGNILFRFDTGGAAIAPFSYSTTTASAADVNISPAGIIRRSTSSAKYKRDIETMHFDRAKFRTLRPVTYRSKVDNDGDRIYGGLIAEEVHAAGYPQFVAYNAKGEPESVMYPHMISELINALHDAEDQIEALEARIAKLETPNG